MHTKKSDRQNQSQRNYNKEEQASDEAVTLRVCTVMSLITMISNKYESR